MIGAIILGAGSSRRFGDDKRRAILANGKMVIQQSIETALACFEQVLLVLRYGDNAFEEEIQGLIGSDKLRIYRAPDSALGMGHSLANAIGEVRDWDGAFVFLADMPHLREETLVQLKNTASAQVESIVVPTFEGRYGHPVGFDKGYFDQIAELEGDNGAKPVIRANADAVIEVPVEDRGVLQDVDTPEDLSS